MNGTITHCPFCGSRKLNHVGYSASGANFYICDKCGLSVNIVEGVKK